MPEQGNLKKKVMLLTHGLYPVPGFSVSGNGIRAWGLAMGLVHHGFDVIYATPADTVHPHTPKPELTLASFEDKSDLREKIAVHGPDLLVVGYWAYMHLVPDDIEIPLVMDLLAPWLLETAFQESYDMELESIDYIKCLHRADFFLCCTQRQKAFHTAWLLMSGFSNRNIPLEVVPISTDPNLPVRPKVPISKDPNLPVRPKVPTPTDPNLSIRPKVPISTDLNHPIQPNRPVPPEMPPHDNIVFLYGGVLWPWRSPEAWIAHLLEILVERKNGELDGEFHGELQLIAGKYPLHESSSSGALDLPRGDRYDAVLKQSDLLPYDEMERLYLTADVGIELSARNLEREFSFSFRVIEYLRCGLPVICNDFLEVAGLIEIYDAGWVVKGDDPTAFEMVVREILSGKVDLDTKRKNAHRLVREKFNCLETVAPLVAFCHGAAAHTKGDRFKEEDLREADPKEDLSNERHSKRNHSKGNHLILSMIRHDGNVHGLQTRVSDLEKALLEKDETLGRQKDLIAQYQRERADWMVLHDKAISSWEKTRSQLNQTLLETQAKLAQWREIAEARRLSSRLKRLCRAFMDPMRAMGRKIETLPALMGLLYRALTQRLFLPMIRRWGKKNLAIVTREDLFPVDHGAAAKIYHTARVLSYEYDEVYLITLDREKFYVLNDGKMHEELYPRLIRGLWYPTEGVLRDRLTAMGIPNKESFLFFPMLDPNFRLRVLYVALQKRISVYQAEFPAFMDACTWAHRLFGGIRSIVEHNLEYDRIADTYGLTDAVRERMKTYEVDLCRRVEHVVAVSQNDRDGLVKAGVDAEKITLIPHGVDLEHFDFGQERDRVAAHHEIRQRYGITENDIVLVFHGIYSYAPNGEAAALIGSRILPSLNEKGYHPKCLAVGKYPPEKSNHPDLIYTDVVPHVAPYIAAADIAVVPLLDGGGTRMKILEYFAAGIPVVATAKGAEGIEVVPGSEIVIEEDMERFVDAVIDLIAHSEKRKAIGDAGRRFVEALDWRKIGKSYVRLYGTHLKKGA